MILTLAFNNPSYISPSSSFDDLAIHFKGHFASTKGIPLQNRLVLAPLKRQITDSAAVRGYDSVSTASSGTIVSTFVVSMVINLFFAGIMSLLVGMLNSMQLIVHLPIMNVAFPANVMIILRVMMPVVMFDILEYKSTILGFVGIEMPNEEAIEVLAIPDQM